jgi:dihydrofolate synthase/folylpolyglutamate synthase
MQFDEALKYLLSLGHETLAIKLGLANTEQLLEALGRPQDAFPSVQIAGTNGKGSTAAMLDAITHAARLRTGLYTSPHLIRITERIKVGGSEISREDFALVAERVRHVAEALVTTKLLPALPTFFEHLTAIALSAFKEAGVQLAILETGMGGRLDATTVARAETLAITPIALDHQEHLGRTLTEIAAEKAAIIRPGTTVVVAPQAPEALRVVMQRCAESGVTPRLIEYETKALGAGEGGRMRATFETKQDLYENVLLNLRGRHQAMNAGVAIALAEAVRESAGLEISRESIIEGLESAEHPGRLEWRSGRPAMLFDGAHNAAGALALRDFLDEFVKAPVTLIFGAMRDKDLEEIAATLFPAAQQLILTAPSNPRAATLETIKKLASDYLDSSKVRVTASPADALRISRLLSSPDDVICVTGSLYLVGEIMQIKDTKLDT